LAYNTSVKLRWIIPFAVVALAILAAPQSNADDGDDDDPEVWEFEIDGISYVVKEEGIVAANQCFSSETDIVIPPVVEYEGVSYQVVTISVLFICNEPERISVPSTVTEIETGTFNCPTLREIEVDPDNPAYCSDDGILYDKAMALLIKYPSAKEDTAFVIPASVSALATHCFGDAKSLASVWLPNSIYIIPNYAFSGCSDLAHVNATTDGNILPSSVRMIGSNAFEGCISLTQLEMPEELVYIEEEAFAGSGLRTFTVNPFLKYIGAGAFAYCTNLERFYDGNGKYEARRGMLFSIDGSDARLHTYPCNSPDEVLELYEGTTSLERMAFSGAKNLKEVTLPSTMTVISPAAFLNCDSLERVVLSESILEIGSSAFHNCRNLKDVEIGEGLVRIDDWAFAFCGMEHLTVPASVRYIGDEAFSGCASLTSMDFMSDYLRVMGNVFNDCTSMSEITFYGTNVTFDSYTFSLMNNEDLAIVYITKDVQLPEYMDDHLSNVDIRVIGERPYPMENLIGVTLCLLILIFIVRFFRHVRAGGPQDGRQDIRGMGQHLRGHGQDRPDPRVHRRRDGRHRRGRRPGQGRTLREGEELDQGQGKGHRR
jgi:hypothetical protein